MSASRTDRTKSVEDRSHTWLTPLVGMGLWLASVAVMTCLVSAVVWWERSANGPVAVIPNQGLWGLPEQKSAALRQVFDGRPRVVDHLRKDEIEAYLTDLVKPEEKKSSKWRGACDGERFRQRVVKSNYVQSLPRKERKVVASKPFDDFWVEGPSQFEHLKFVHICPATEFGQNGTSKPLDDEVLVFTYGRRGYHDWEPVVFWVHGPVGDLKLSDWEFVGSGIAESEHAGFYEAATRDPAAEELFSYYRYVREIDGLSYSDSEKFEQTMKLAEACQVPQAWEDLARYILMVRWSNWSRNDDVCRLADQVKNPERIPGILALHASSNSRLDQEDRALALIAQSENVIGFRPDLSELRARLLSNRRRDEALAEWQRLVDFDSSDVSHLSQLFQLLPKARKFEVIERIKSQSDSATLSLNFAQYNSYRLPLPMFQELSRHVDSVSPDSNEAFEIKVLQLRSQKDFAAAAQLNREAAERETDPQLKRTRWASFLIDMHSAGEVLAGFEAHPDPKAAFITLVRGLEEGEASLSIDELPPILAAYRKQQPDDPWLTFYEGYYAADQQDYQQADERYLEAERLALQVKEDKESDHPAKDDEVDDEENDPEHLLSMICRERCRTRYELGDDVELLTHYPKSEDAFRALAEKAVGYRHWAVLNRINQAFRQDDPANPWLAHYSVRLAIANQEFPTARSQLKDMEAREAEVPILKYFRHQLQRELVAAENPDPLRRFELSEDRSAAFQQISDALLDEQDWASFEKLCLRHPDGPDSPDVALARLEQAWRRDHAKVVQLLTPWPEKTFSKKRYHAPTWRDRLVRSFLRLQRRDEALAISQDAKQRFGEIWPMIMTCVANRDVEKLEQLLSDDESAVDQWRFRNLADDPELRPLLLDDAFADFRNRHAFDLPDYEYSPTLILLLKKPVEITAEWLSSRLSEPKTPESSLQISRVSATRFVVSWNQMRFLLTAVAEPCFAAEVLADPAITKHLPDLVPETRELFAKQQACWQIVSLGDANGDEWNSAEHQCRQFAAKLLSDDIVGIAYRPWLSTMTTVIPFDWTQAGPLSGHQPLVELNRNAVILHNRQPRPLKLDDEKRQLLKAMADKPDTDLLKRVIASVQLTGGDHPWHEDFELLEVKLQQYGDLEIIAKYCGPDYSNSLGELRSGIRYLIPLERIIDIRQQELAR